MYHIVGVTPEASSLESALGSKAVVETLTYGPAERRRIYETERQRPQHRRRLRDARLSALLARPDPRCVPAARGPQGQHELQPVDLHLARREERGRETRLYEGYPRCRRRAVDRYLLGHQPGGAAGNQGCRRWIRPSRRTTCRPWSGSRLGSGRPRIASMQRSPVAGKEKRHEYTNDHVARAQGRRR